MHISTYYCGRGAYLLEESSFAHSRLARANHQKTMTFDISKSKKQRVLSRDVVEPIFFEFRVPSSFEYYKISSSRVYLTKPKNFDRVSNISSKFQVSEVTTKR